VKVLISTTNGWYLNNNLCWQQWLQINKIEQWATDLVLFVKI